MDRFIGKVDNLN